MILVAVFSSKDEEGEGGKRKKRKGSAGEIELRYIIMAVKSASGPCSPFLFS